MSTQRKMVDQHTTAPNKRRKTDEIIARDICLSLIDRKGNAIRVAAACCPDGRNPTGIDLSKVRSVFDFHGFRTSVVKSPRSALSIYKDSCVLDANKKTGSLDFLGSKAFLTSIFGCHPLQSHIEGLYSSTVKSIYCGIKLCERLRNACPSDCIEGKARELIEAFEAECDMATKAGWGEVLKSLAMHVPEKLADIMSAVVEKSNNNCIRMEQLLREKERIYCQNSTFANARMLLFLGANNCIIKDIFFKKSHEARFERITVYLYDPEIDFVKPPIFIFLPALEMALCKGPAAMCTEMTESFWAHMLRFGYYASDVTKAELSPTLEKFFSSGISKGQNIPLQLNAHFDPSYQLSFFFHGNAGAGKSSLVKNFAPALNLTLGEYVDPEMLVRFVKQNLNKPIRTLQLEMELRPNNNDLSVMSIIQGRRMTLSQSKPGLVVVDFEEMGSNEPSADPNQLQTAELISQRFSGQNGSFKSAKAPPRNSGKRGISGDATLLTLFTSNYDLEQPSVDALKRIDMFSNLKVVHMKAVEDDDRADFAKTYLKQCVHDTIGKSVLIKCLSIPMGTGDTRPLVRHLRMISFFVCSLNEKVSQCEAAPESDEVHINFDAKTRLITVGVTNETILLRIGTFDNIYRIDQGIVDNRAKKAFLMLRSNHINNDKSAFNDLAQILDYYFGKALAPAVVISKDATLITNLCEAVGAQNDVHLISGKKVSETKMMKSLYDPSDTPNLRDEILNYGEGSFVVTELLCSTIDDQLCIREILEDTPSMTAFSSSKSALYKEGLLFGVHIGSGEITPELRSRASLIL